MPLQRAQHAITGKGAATAASSHRLQDQPSSKGSPECTKLAHAIRTFGGLRLVAGFLLLVGLSLGQVSGSNLGNGNVKGPGVTQVPPTMNLKKVRLGRGTPPSQLPESALVIINEGARQSVECQQLRSMSVLIQAIQQRIADDPPNPTENVSMHLPSERWRQPVQAEMADPFVVHLLEQRMLADLWRNWPVIRW